MMTKFLFSRRSCSAYFDNITGLSNRELRLGATYLLAHPLTPSQLLFAT